MRRDECMAHVQVKRGFVVLQRMLTSCRSHVIGEKAEEAADSAKALGFRDLAKGEII